MWFMSSKRLEQQERLIEIIGDNPNCTVELDNDAWWLYNSENMPLTDYHEYPQLDNTHGRAVLEALASLQGIGVEYV